MDPLFERRELTRSVHLDARFLQRNIQSSILAQLRMKLEGTCVAEGYIQPQSITVVEHSLGRANLIRGGLDYMVKFQADICMPHAGQVFRAPVVLRSKIGVHAEVAPLKVLLPRDIHIGNEDFESIEEKQDVEFEVVGSRFQQGDDSIVVLAKLRSVIRPEKFVEPETVAAPASEPMIAAPVGRDDSADAKRVVTVDIDQTKPTAARPKRVRLNTKKPTNEQGAEGAPA